jgi:hypothetical protein
MQLKCIRLHFRLRMCVPFLRGPPRSAARNKNTRTAHENIFIIFFITRQLAARGEPHTTLRCHGRKALSGSHDVASLLSFER